MVQQPHRVFQNIMHAHGCQCGRLGRGEPEHLRGEAVNALEFALHHLGHLAVGVFFDEDVDERIDGDEAVFDFVRDAGGDDAEVGELIQPAKVGLPVGRCGG